MIALVAWMGVSAGFVGGWITCALLTDRLTERSTK